MNIQDIIKAATPGPWRASGHKGLLVKTDARPPAAPPIASITGETGSYGRDHWYDRSDSDGVADARFIAAFDPEHVALMEAERVAAREFITERVSGVGFVMRKYNEWADACEATDRYRKERGL